MRAFLDNTIETFTAHFASFHIADNILTDSKGRIIARGLSYADLTKKIEETFRPKAK